MPQNSTTNKPKMSREQRTRSRNQIIIIGLSVIIVISMIFSLVSF